MRWSSSSTRSARWKTSSTWSESKFEASIWQLTEDGNVEMLFLDPDYRGRGGGSLLLRHAFTSFAATSVDVNEQNPQALGFYQHHGFRVVSRSTHDSTGKPYPILHLTV